MFVRYLQVFAVTVYIVVAIGVVAYLGGSFFWLIPLLTPAVYFLFVLPEPRPRQPSAPLPRSPEFQARIDARVAELRAGPAHRNQAKYVDEVNLGFLLTDNQIDYREFPDKLVLCEHLQPLESTLRKSGLRMEHIGRQVVEVSATFRTGEIRQRFQFPGCVVFTRGERPDNHAPHSIVIQCSLCGAELRESGWGAPWPKE